MMKKIVVALDLGGTKIKIGLVRQAEIIASIAVDALSGESLRNRLPAIAQTVNELLARHGFTAADVTAFGIATPGIVDFVQKKVLTIDKKHEDAPEINWPGWVQDTWGLPMVLENDARAALVGEWQYGHGQGYDNVVAMTLGTGIGSAALIAGNVLRGKHYLAGILGGHSTINYKGGKCGCGNIGCVELEAATWSITAKVKAHPDYSRSCLQQESKIDFEALFRCATNKDSLAIAMRNECLDIWAACAVNLVHAYDPEVMVIGGGIMASKADIIPYLQQRVDENSWAPAGQVVIREAQHINTAALLGIYYLTTQLTR
jgi:glucokinase